MIFIIFASSLWALDTLIRFPLSQKGIDPLVIVFLEHSVLAFLCFPLLLRGLPSILRLNPSRIFSFLVIGAGGSALATASFTAAFAHLNPSLVILLQKLQPVVAIVLAHLVLREPVGPRFLLWASVCLAGGVLVAAEDVEKFWLVARENPYALLDQAAVRGYGFTFVSILGWGASAVYARKLSLDGFSPVSMAAGRFCVGFATLLLLVPKGAALVLPESADYARVAGLALFSGGLAMWLYYLGVKRLPAKLVCIFELFFPVFAVAVNWIFLDQSLTVPQIAGALMLVSGAVVLQIKRY